MNTGKHSRKKSRGTSAPLVIAVIFVCACALVLVLTLNGTLQPIVAQLTGQDSQESSDQQTQQSQEESPVEPKQFSYYTWDELSRISTEIAAAPDDDSGRQLAEYYNLVDENGVPTGSTREVVLSDNTLAYARIVGIRHDQRSDGQGVAGITLMLSMVSEQPMNQENSSDGGWESSWLRSWLSSDGMSLLPEDLQSVIVAVDKATNNVGETSDVASVTTTSDTLWLFSAKEVCGRISWFSDEFGTEISGTADYDEVLNAEGSQYEYFSANGVTQDSSGTGVLALTYRGSARTWWYRSAYPLNYMELNPNGYFYRASETGYPSSVGTASETSGVVVGFCL